MEIFVRILSISFLLFSAEMYGQTPIATLHHDGGSTVFYGTTAFTTAYAAAVNGDTILLSSGTFTSPGNILKSLKIIGAGHYPDTVSTTAIFRTLVSENLNFGNGTSNSLVEGMYFTNALVLNNTSPINNFRIIRCRVDGGILFNNTSAKDSVLIEACIANLNTNNTITNNLVIRNSIIPHLMRNITNGNASLIENNVFLHYASDGYSTRAISNINNALIKNNIFYNPISITATGCNFLNNLFSLADMSLSQPSNTFIGNYWGVSQSAIFVNQTGTSFSYSHNYHLQSPSLWLGTDGTEIGIYGGNHPYKESAVPSTPHIEIMQISPNTDASGNLPVFIKVMPQND